MQNVCYANVCGGVNIHIYMYVPAWHWYILVPGALVEVRVGSKLSDGTQHRLLVQLAGES